MKELVRIAAEQLAIQKCIDATKAIDQDECPSDDETKSEQISTYLLK